MPATLPRLTSSARHPKSSSLIAEVVANIIFLAWWLAVPTYPFLMLGPAANFLHFSPSWSQLYPAMFVPATVATLTALGLLMAPSWTWLARFRPLLANLSGLFLVSVALNAGDLVIAAHDKHLAVSSTLQGVFARLWTESCGAPSAGSSDVANVSSSWTWLACDGSTRRRWRIDSSVQHGDCGTGRVANRPPDRLGAGILQRVGLFGALRTVRWIRVGPRVLPR